MVIPQIYWSLLTEQYSFLCTGRQRARTCDTALAVCKRELYSSGAVHGNKSSFEFSPSTPRPFSSSFMLNLWQKKIMRPKLYVCSKCNQSFGYMGNLSRHRKACEGKFHLKCSFCDKVFYRQDVLKIHLASKHCLPSSSS